MRMRTKALIVLGLVALLAPGVRAQQGYQVYPDEYLPSLPATKVDRTTVAPPTVAPDLESTLYKMADYLGMLRRQQDVDSIITVDYRGTGTMTYGGQARNLESYRASVRYDVPGMRADFTFRALRRFEYNDSAVNSRPQPYEIKGFRPVARSQDEDDSMAACAGPALR